MSNPVRIILVDDHRLFRDGLKRLLASDKNFEVVGEASNGEEFLKVAEAVGQGFSAQSAEGGIVVFMDIDMPGMGGVEASRQVLKTCPGLKIIALSMHSEQEFYMPMVEAGVKGFMLKSSEFSEVVTAALTVAAGGTYFSGEIVTSLARALRHSEVTADARGGGSLKEVLSEREAEVLPLVCEGLSNNEIADRLFISKRTVDKHRANILAKTGCHNTASLVVYAVKNKIIEI